MNNQLILLLSAMLWLTACAKEPIASAQQKSLPELESIKLQPSTISQEVKFDGVVEAINQATVSSQTSGRILEIPVDVGDYVAKGDVIIRFTNTEQKARAASAQAQFNEAKAQFTRMQEMLTKKLIAKADFDKSEANFKSAEANLREAEQNLAYTEIHAPYAGIVVTRPAKVGETVAPGTPLMTGLSLEQLRVKVDVPQEHIGLIRKFKQARVLTNDGSVIAASSLRISPSADAQTHSFTVLINLPEGDHKLSPGTFIKVAFMIGETQKLLIPQDAVALRGEVAGVYVIKQNTLEFRHINLGTLTADNTYPVLAGLSSDEIIALDPIAATLAYQSLHNEE